MVLKRKAHPLQDFIIWEYPGTSPHPGESDLFFSICMAIILTQDAHAPLTQQEQRCQMMEVCLRGIFMPILPHKTCFPMQDQE